MADPVWWNLDLFLAETISRNLRDYVRKGNAIPSEYTEESWKAKLESIATKLEAYQNRFSANADQELFLVNQAKEAMHELADIFPALWD